MLIINDAVDGGDVLGIYSPFQLFSKNLKVRGQFFFLEYSVPGALAIC